MYYARYVRVQFQMFELWGEKESTMIAQKEKRRKERKKEKGRFYLFLFFAISSNSELIDPI